MAPHSVQGSEELGASIRQRRLELGLSIAEAANKAHVGQKTWARYESGASIRTDKVPYVLRVLRWKEFPLKSAEEEESLLSQITQDDESWSPYIESMYGSWAAAAFAMAIDVVDDQIREDLDGLAHEPVGTHVGQLENSWLASALPPQFLMKYDYDFVYALQVAVHELRVIARSGKRIVPHRVVDELILTLLDEEIEVLKDLDMQAAVHVFEELPEGLAGEFCDDMDFVTFCYMPTFLIPHDFAYHFDNWFKPQFWIDDEGRDRAVAE